LAPMVMLHVLAMDSKFFFRAGLLATFAMTT
jgi:hypothetical protein